MNLNKIQKQFSKYSSVQIILIAIIIHFIVSISFLHFFISWFFENNSILKNDDLSTIENSDNGFLKLQNGPNLIRNNLISKNEISIVGWWFDHFVYQTDIECAKSNLNPCSKVFSTDCKPDRIRAMYQFINIREDFDLNEVEVSLFSKTGKLIELNEDRSYGLQMIVRLSNDELDYLNIEFSYDLDEWYKRKARFNIYSSNLKISQITVMLYCFGYTGKVMFKDVVIRPTNKTLTKNLVREDIISDCESPSFDKLNNFNLPNYLTIEMGNYALNENKKFNNELNRVTLVSQVSMDRMQILERTLVNWNGPISLAVHIPVQDVKNGLDQWQLIYLEKKLKLLNLSANSKVVLVVSNEKENVYPINVLRNAAFKNVQTDYAFLVDADFVPCPEMETKLERHLYNFHRTQFKNYDSNKLAFVIPAFEYIENQRFEDSIPKTKEEFMQLIFREEPIIQPFRIVESIESHRLTNYWKWYISSKPYLVINGVKSTHSDKKRFLTKPNGYSDKYEPYLVIKKTTDTPLFDQRFTGYGMNKVTFITELFVSNYTFFVLPDVWITHFPHKNSIYSQEFLQNAHLRLKNRFSRFQFICKLISKYNLTRK